MPKLRKFVDQVDDLPDDHINYSYRSRVVGSRGTDDTSAKEGVINRFHTQIQERVKALPVENNASRAIAQSQKVITGEIVATTPETSLVNYTNSIESSVQQEDIVTRLEKLAKLREQGMISEAEFQNAKKQIIGL